MSFYSLSKQERAGLLAIIENDLITGIKTAQLQKVTLHFGHADTYIRRSAYLTVGRTFFSYKDLQTAVVECLDKLFLHNDFRIRQTVINAAGEIGRKNFEHVQRFFDKGLTDKHHSARNAVIGSIKKMCAVNPQPVLSWARKYLHHPDKEIRREICHGIELRGRKFPEDILPLLQELQNDDTARVRNTLVHVIGQIAYKKDCLPTVIRHLKTWHNKELVAKALNEIIDVHYRYRNFSALSQKQARQYIKDYYFGEETDI